jgi:hypothetical protein
VKTRHEFAREIASLKLSHVERAIAILWYYRETQEYEERTASELATDLHEEGFPKPNVTRLHQDLTRSRYTTRGRRPRSFQLDLRRLDKLDEKYKDLLDIKPVDVSGAIIPPEWVARTRVYLERMVHQINGCYDFGFYDGCATLCRRLMESLIIEIYIAQGRHQEIQSNRLFLPLDRLIAQITSDATIPLNRNTPRIMRDIKQIGDTASHDVYSTQSVHLFQCKPSTRSEVNRPHGRSGATLVLSYFS